MTFKTITLFFLLLVYLMFVSTANASPLIQKITTTNSDSIKLNLSYEETKAPAIIDFEKMKPVNFIDFIKNQYLTLYSNKAEKLKITYKHHTYTLYYTHKW